MLINILFLLGNITSLPESTKKNRKAKENTIIEVPVHLPLIKERSINIESERESMLVDEKDHGENQIPIDMSIVIDKEDSKNIKIMSASEPVYNPETKKWKRQFLVERKSTDKKNIEDKKLSACCYCLVRILKWFIFLVLLVLVILGSLHIDNNLTFFEEALTGGPSTARTAMIVALFTVNYIVIWSCTCGRI